MDAILSHPYLPRIVALGALAVLCAFFAATETSLFALGPLDRLRLKERRRARGEQVEALLARPRRLLVTALIGVETINILASVLATSLALSIWGDRGKWLVLGIIAPAFLLVGELLPKSLALVFPARLAEMVAPLVRPAIIILTPVRVVFLQVSRGLLAMLGFRPELPVTGVHQEDFVRMVEESHSRGMIAAMERDFIQNLLAFGELRVGQLMVPRPDMFMLPLDMPFPEMVQAIKNSRFTRVPIYEENPDNVLGILHTKDILEACYQNTCDMAVLRNLLRPVTYVPENKKAFDLLTELQSQHLRLALVVDEYGALVGLVSVEDLLEELCGEIPQEFQAEEKLLEELAPGVWRVKAAISLAEFNEALGTALPAAEIDTLGGFVLNLFGALPREGRKISHNQLIFKVARMKGTRILELEVRLKSD